MKKILNVFLFTMFFDSAVLFANPFSIEWKEAHNLPVPVGGCMAGWYENKIVLAGGTTWKEDKKYYLSKTYLFNPKINVWEEMTELPIPLSYGGGVSLDNNFYILSGSFGSFQSKEVYSLARKGNQYLWQPVSPLPEPRIYSTCTAYRKKIYLIGGTSDPNNLSENSLPPLLYKIDSPQRDWSNFKSIPGTSPHLAASAFCGGNLCLFGGCIINKEGKIKNLKDAYCYNPQKDEWRRISSLPYPVRGLVAVSYRERYIFLIGGYRTFFAGSGSETNDFIDTILVYDTKTDTYLETTPLPYKAMGMFVLIKGDTLYVGGGEDKPRHRTEKFFIGKIKPEIKRQGKGY